MTSSFALHLNVLIRRLFGRLRVEQDGTILITMVAAVIPLTFLIGFGVDYSRAEMLQTQLNAAADAAALAGVDPTIILQPDATATTAASNMFNAQASKLNGLASYSMTPQVADAASGSGGALGYLRKVTVAYTAKTQNLFSTILGVPTLTIAGTSTASAQQPPNINFYLAMDNSPSMLLPSRSSGLTAVTNATSTSQLSSGCDFACHEQMPHNDNIYINDTSGRQVLLSTNFYTTGSAQKNTYYLWDTNANVLYNSAGTSMNTSSTSTSGNSTTVTNVTYSITDSTTGPVTITQSTSSTTTTTTTGRHGQTSTSTSTSGPTYVTYDTGYWADGYWLTHNYGNLYGSPSTIPLRKDDVVSAASQLIPYAASQSSQYHVTYQMQMFAYNWTHPSASSPVVTLNSMANVNSFGTGYSVAGLFPTDDYWYQNSAPTSSTNINDQGTEFGNMLNYMNGIMPTAGTGAVGSTPQEIMFIISDGMTDEDSNGRSLGPLNSSDIAKCTAIKAKGIKIAILYTEYLSQALIGDSWSQTNVAPFLPAPPSGFPAGNAGTSDQVLTALQTCASPGSNGNPLVQTVTTNGDITVALQQLFSTALQAPRLVR